MRLDHIRSEIAFMRLQAGRQRKEILLLQRAGIPTTIRTSPFIKALAEVRQLATREGLVLSACSSHRGGNRPVRRESVRTF